MKFFEFIIAHFPFLSNVVETVKNIFDIKKIFYETKAQKKKGDDNITIVVFGNVNILQPNITILLLLVIESSIKTKSSFFILVYHKKGFGTTIIKSKKILVKWTAQHIRRGSSCLNTLI